MANVKITDLTAYTDAASTDVLAIVDVSNNVTKKISISDLLKATPLGTAALPAIAIDGDPNTGIYSPGADQLAFSTGGTGRLFIDNSGRVGIGTSSPSSTLTVSSSAAANTFPLHLENPTAFGWGVGLKFRQPLSSGGAVIDSGAVVSDWDSTNGGTLEFYTTSGAVLTERLRIDSSGRVGIGTSSPNRKLEISDATVDNLVRVNTTGATKSGIEFTNGGTAYAQIYFNNTSPYDFSLLQQYTTGSLILGTNNTERMRIGNDGTIDTYGTPTEAAYTARVSYGSGTIYGFFAGRHSASSTSTGTNSFFVYTNGNVVNSNGSYGVLSDLKLKENIVDASSQWSDIKSIRIRKYNFKEETGQETHTQIGVVAQELELVSPGLIIESPDRDEAGNDLGTVTKSVNQSALYMKAVKALQEAMERIETLEAKVAALEGA